MAEETGLRPEVTYYHSHSGGSDLMLTYKLSWLGTLFYAEEVQKVDFERFSWSIESVEVDNTTLVVMPGYSYGWLFGLFGISGVALVAVFGEYFWIRIINAT